LTCRPIGDRTTRWATPRLRLRSSNTAASIAPRVAAHDIIANLRDHFGDRLRYVFRHRPLSDNEDARRAAELAEYAHETSDRYWEAHDALIRRGPRAGPKEFDTVAAELALPPRAGAHEAAWRRAQARVQEDIESARLSGARVSPTFFINGRRYDGP
jgi:NhaA family Na+:H+ antiporter